MNRLRIALALSLIAAPVAVPADKLPPELALIPPDAAAFVSVRFDLLINSSLGKSPAIAELLRKPELADQIENRWLGFPLSEVERVTIVYPTLPIRELADNLPLFVVTRTKKLDRAAVLTRFWARPFTSNRDQGRPPPPQRGLMWESRHGLVFCFAGDRTMLMAPRQSAAILLHMLAQLVDPSPNYPLEPALTAATGKNALVAGATGSAFRALVGLSPQKDKEFTALGRASAVTMAANLEPDFKLTVKADFPDQVTAREGQSALAAMTGWATDALKGLAAGPDKADADLARLVLASLRDAGEPVREGKAVSIVVRMTADEFARTGSAFTQIAVTRIQTASNRMKSANNLSQMALAIHNFESVYGQFPFTDRPMGVANPDLSWRVAILPYIEADELYKQFKLDEPWDSENNKKLIEKMPKVFAPPPGVEAKAGHTFYRMFDGPGTMYQMKTISDVTDGTSNTLLIVEASESVVWTKPDELGYDPKKPLPKLGGHFPDGFNALLGDGSVRFVRKGIDEKVLRALITANGGEPVTLDKD